MRAFEEAGARVEEISLPLTTDQRELSDVWCRLMIPAHVAALRALHAQGIDVAGEHRADVPPALARAGREARRSPTRCATRSCEPRSFDVLTSAFDRHDLLVGPTLCCLPLPNADDGDTVGPSRSTASRSTS